MEYKELPEGELLLYFFIIFMFLTGFFGGLLLSYGTKKFKRTIAWLETSRYRTKCAIMAGFGAILGLIGYYGLATNTGLIKLILGIEVHTLLEGLLLAGFVLFGMAFLGLGLALLIYPIKKPSTDKE